jgi:hypothetical protein
LVLNINFTREVGLEDANAAEKKRGFWVIPGVGMGPGIEKIKAIGYVEQRPVEAGGWAEEEREEDADSLQGNRFVTKRAASNVCSGGEQGGRPL